MRAAVMVGVALAPTAVSAEFPRRLETAGRLYGVGWGDGYHACASSGVRLGADLPPKSYSASYGVKPHAKPMGIVHRIGATYYDRFDAANSRPCDAPYCDSRPCNSSPCDANRCDSAPFIARDGSQVSQTPDALNPMIATPEQDLPLSPATPTEALEVRKTPTPQSEPLIELTQPLTSVVPPTKKHPTRPKPPVLSRRSDAIPVATKQQVLELPTPEKVITEPENEFTDGNQLTVGNWGQVIRNRSESRPLSTTTPGSIAAIHPGSPPSIPARLSLPGNPIATSTPSLEVLAPRNRELAPTSVAPTSKPKVASAPAASQGFVPSYAVAPYIGPVVAPTTTPTRAIERSPAHPMRLGTETDQAPAANVAIKSVADVKRPTRLGDGDADQPVNPFDSRPVVEMAKRSGNVSHGVIFQPGGGTLK